MRTLGFCAIAAAAALLFAPGSMHAAISGLTRVASGLSNPIFVTHAPGDRSRLFIAQRGGAIRILNLDTGMLETTPFLTMSGVSTDNEGGFLGLAFHPDYFNEGMPGFGKFYVNVTTNSTTVTHIREFEVLVGNPNLADSGSLREILSFSQPQTNHDGGWIGFSPNDNFLYVATGDGGGSDDNDAGHTAGTGNGQDITNNLLGKMLRIDPTGDDFLADTGRNYAIPPANPFKAGVGDPADDIGDDEIWAYGLRNPFRDSFDRVTGDLWIGDVGQGAREEIDFQRASSTGGENYGWRLREGTIATPSGGVGGTCTGCIEPVYDYARPLANPNNDPAIDEINKYRGTVVTGGYVYRGPDPSLQGKYFFLDSRNTGGTSDDNYWMFDPANPYGSVTNINAMLVPNTGSVQFPDSFGEDVVGNLYIAYLNSGEVYRIATNQLLAGDYNADGEVDMADYDLWRESFGGALANPPAEGNGNGIADAADYVIWRKNLGASVHDGIGGGGASVPEPSTVVFLFQLLVLGLMNGVVRGRSTYDAFQKAQRSGNSNA